MTQQIITALVLGLIGGIVPGPVLTATFTEILQSGFYKSFRIVFLALAMETVVALVSLVVLYSLSPSLSFFNALSFIGVGILIWIALQLWKIKTVDINEGVHFSAGKIAAMILANGVLWTFWITVCVPKAVSLGEQIHYGQFLFLLVVELGWLISTLMLALVFSWFRNALSSPQVIPYLFKFFSLVFLYFAFEMLYNSVLYFI